MSDGYKKLDNETLAAMAPHLEKIAQGFAGLQQVVSYPKVALFREMGVPGDSGEEILLVRSSDMSLEKYGWAFAARDLYYNKEGEQGD